MEERQATYHGDITDKINIELQKNKGKQLYFNEIVENYFRKNTQIYKFGDIVYFEVFHNKKDHHVITDDNGTYGICLRPCYRMPTNIKIFKYFDKGENIILYLELLNIKYDNVLNEIQSLLNEKNKMGLDWISDYDCKITDFDKVVEYYRENGLLSENTEQNILK
jgi:hypothetical protein